MHRKFNFKWGWTDRTFCVLLMHLRKCVVLNVVVCVYVTLAMTEESSALGSVSFFTRPRGNAMRYEQKIRKYSA